MNSTARTLLTLLAATAAAPAAAQCEEPAHLSAVGTGTSGTFGVPRIRVVGAPVVGESVRLDVLGGAPQSPGLLVLSQVETAFALPAFGAVLHVAPPFQISALFGIGAGSVSEGLLELPSVPASLCGVSFVAQALVTDPGAQGGLAFSAGQRVIFGSPAGAEGLYPERRYRTAEASYPEAVLVVDLDADGTPDVLTAGTGSGLLGMVSSLRGTGGGELASAVGTTVNGTAYDLDAADLDGDGVLDLAVASDELTLLFGDGAGGFASSVALAAGASPEAVAVGHLDGDGAPDVVVANEGSDDLSVFLSAGGGTFSAPVSVPVGAAPVDLELADLDGTGGLDLAVLERDAGTLSILLGQGDGTFSAGATYAVGSEPFDLTAGHLDADGELDLVVTNDLDELRVLRGAGDGTFTADPPVPTGSNPRAVAVADLDGDGTPELVVGRIRILAVEERPTVEVYASEAGGFALQAELVAGERVLALAATDLDGDSHPDLVLADSHPRDVAVLLGRGDGTFPTRVRIEVPIFVTATSDALAAADLDGDGLADLVGTHQPIDSVSGALSLGDGSFGPQAATNVGADQPTKLLLADLDLDGALDAVTSCLGAPASDRLSVLLGDGDGSFTAHQLLTPGTSNPGAPAVGDLDGDGLPDLAMPYSSDDAIFTFLGTGGGSFAEADVLGINAPRVVALGDANGDGNDDLVAFRATGGLKVTVVPGNGDGTFGPRTDYPAMGEIWGIRMADLDLDGDLDLVLEYPTPVTTGIALMFQGADGLLSPLQFIDDGGDTSSSRVADVTADGLPDIVVANHGGARVSILAGLGGGLFAAPVSYGTERVAITPAVGDFDGDGLLDIASHDAGGPWTVLLRSGLP